MQLSPWPLVDPPKAQEPIGKRVRILVADQPWTEIVGVTGHLLNATPDRDVRPQIYWPESQRNQDRAALGVRTFGHPESFTAAIIDQIRKQDRDQSVYDVRTMDEWMSRTLSTRNLITWLVTAFAVASPILACLGLYGVLSYTNRLRSREFAIRMALGAQSGACQKSGPRAGRETRGCRLWGGHRARPPGWQSRREPALRRDRLGRCCIAGWTGFVGLGGAARKPWTSTEGRPAPVHKLPL
jgi:hypothetical protein